MRAFSQGKLTAHIAHAFGRRILLELNPSDDPVWIFFDTQYKHITTLLKSSEEKSTKLVQGEGCVALLLRCYG